MFLEKIRLWEKQQKMSSEKGYSMWIASLFMVSFNAGLGVLAFPRALAGTGWFGILLMLLACVNSCYGAVVLGRIWIIMENKWEEHRDKCRYPYPAMGMRAIGPRMRCVVTTVLHLTAVGVSVVYLLLSAQVAHSMTESLFTLGYKYFIVILGAILCPLTWFGSIEKFKFAGIGALATIIFACLGMIIATLLAASTFKEPVYETPNISSASLAFGTIMFSFGGIFFYPTVLMEMKHKEKFSKAAILSFAGLLIIFVPVAIVGYFVFGSSVESSLVNSIEKGPLRTAIEVSLAIHTFLAFLLAINPVLQEVEEAFNIAPVFNYKRCLVRALIVCIIILLAYIVPHFDKVLSLVGGSTTTLLTFIFPPLFYFMIQEKVSESKENPSKIKCVEGTVLLQICLVGIAGGLSSTYFAVMDIVDIFLPHLTNSTLHK